MLRRSEERVKGMKESRVMGREIGVRVLDEDTRSKGGIGSDVGVFVNNPSGNDL